MPFGAGSLCSRNRSWCRNGQLDRVGDHLDLLVEAADVVVVDVRHLFEGQVLDLGAGQLLEDEAGAGVEQDGVAVAELHVPHRVDQLDDALLVGPAHDEGAVAVEALLEDHDLAGQVGAAGQHDVERLVEDDLGAAGEGLVGDLGVDGHADLAAAGEHVDGAVLVVADDRAVGRRRLGELVDLLAERGDVVARLAEGVGELLVLATRPGTAGPSSRAGAPRACGRASGASWRRRRSDRTSSSRVRACSCSSASSASPLHRLVGLVDGDHLLGSALGRTLHPRPPGSARGFVPKLPCLFAGGVG